MGLSKSCSLFMSGFKYHLFHEAFLGCPQMSFKMPSLGSNCALSSQQSTIVFEVVGEYLSAHPSLLLDCELFEGRNHTAIIFGPHILITRA